MLNTVMIEIDKEVVEKVAHDNELESRKVVRGKRVKKKKNSD
jgi:hypothetical protein